MGLMRPLFNTGRPKLRKIEAAERRDLINFLPKQSKTISGSATTAG
jgi:hypothetical protein